MVLARAGWAISAAAFLLVASAVLHADHTGWFPAGLLVFVIAICAWRPVSGLEIVVAAMPLSWYLMSQRWNGTISWAEVAACAAIAGLSIDAALRPRAGRVPATVAIPALLFGLVVCSAIAASLTVKSLTLGPGFGTDIVRELTGEYFVDIKGFPGLHAGMLLLEGVMLFALAARVTSAKPTALLRIGAATVIGATLAGLMNIALLLEAALRSDTPLAALVNLVRTSRLNVGYPDVNAAGSYFVMALFLAAATIVARSHRRWWTIDAIIIAAALWLTGSRAAYVAGILALGAALAIRWTARERRRVFVAGAVGVALAACVTLVAFASPLRDNQGSSGTAIGIRLGMALAGARMIEARPTFGVGLGEFYQRSGEFVSQKLLAEFPPSLHENAHNNFVQVVSELGLVGGVPFVWLVAAGLWIVTREARRAADSDPVPLLITAAVVSFVITWLAGHPLLIPEASGVFWIVFGAAVGATAVVEPPTPQRLRWLMAAVIAAAIVGTTPLRMKAMTEDAELEHLGVNLSSVWQSSPDGVRFRVAEGHATVFVPAASGLEFSVNPRTDHPVLVEMRLDGRLADIVSLAPGRWNELRLPARRRVERSRYSPLELRVENGDHIEIWVTKVRPLID
jgi:hypothetical protein